MKLYFMNIIIVIVIVSCVTSPYYRNSGKDVLFIYNHQKKIFFDKKNSNLSETYDQYIQHFSKIYNVDPILIKSIIQVESNYNPNVVSKSNAVGLMQIKADTAGKDAYRLKGWLGQPSTKDLKNAIINIELGTAYLSILQNQLSGIIDMRTKRYAVIVAYVNGLGALLKMFSIHNPYAVKKINALSPDQFYEYIQHHHSSVQAKRYLFKVNSVYTVNNKSK